MRFRFASIVVASIPILVMSCSSGDFKVAGSTPTDGGGDSTSDPCAPVADIATFCATVKPVGSHPGYDVSTGAPSLGLDGHGELSLLMFTEDPAKNRNAKPAFTIKYDKTDLDIDHDLPVTIHKGAPEGTYWFAAVFEDDTVTARNPNVSNGSLAGDFVTVPNIVSSEAGIEVQFPEATLTKGATAKTDIDLLPIRRVITDLRPTGSAALGTGLMGAAAKNPYIHGDGPIEYVIYDGNIDDKVTPPTIYDYAIFSDCTNIFTPNIDPTKRYPIQIPIYTVVEGKHNILALLYDYGFPDKDFPGKGTIISPIHDVGLEKVPKVDPSGSWSTEVEVPMAAVPEPVTSDTADPYVCK